MHLPQPYLVDMGVDLRGGEAGVTEHFLDGAQVRAVTEQMRREGMPQEVRPDLPLYASVFCHVAHELPDAPRGQPATVLAEKHFAAGARLDPLRPTPRQPCIERIHRLAADRVAALFRQRLHESGATTLNTARRPKVEPLQSPAIQEYATWSEFTV